MAPREDPLVAEFRKDYARFFRDVMTTELNIWRKFHAEGLPDNLGSYNPSQVMATSHRTAWEMALKYSEMHAPYSARERRGLPDPNLEELELRLYWNAVENIAPSEWRSQFLGKPPPKEKLGGIYGDHSGDH